MLCSLRIITSIRILAIECTLCANITTLEIEDVKRLCLAIYLREERNDMWCEEFTSCEPLSVMYFSDEIFSSYTILSKFLTI